MRFITSTTFPILQLSGGSGYGSSCRHHGTHSRGRCGSTLIWSFFRVLPGKTTDGTMGFRSVCTHDSHVFMAVACSTSHATCLTYEGNILCPWCLGFVVLGDFLWIRSHGIHHHEKPPFGTIFLDFFQPPNTQI